MKRRLSYRLLLVAGILALAAFTSARVSAFGRTRDVKAKIGKQVTQALDAVKATPNQRNSVQAAIQEVMRTAEEAFGGAQGLPDFEEFLNVFSRPRLDPAAIGTLKSKREVRHKKLADALTQAFYDVHDALTAQQREQLLDYARGRAGEGKHMRKFKSMVIEGFVKAQVEDLLDQLAADEHERQVVHAAQDEVVAALKKAQATKQASIEELGSLFRGETIDKAALARFRSDKEAQVKEIADAIERAVTQVHDGLSAEHRQKLVELVRARRDRAKNAPHTDEGF